MQIYLQALVQTLFSQSFYQKIVFEKRFKLIPYILVLSSILAISQTYMIKKFFNNFYHNTIGRHTENLPEVQYFQGNFVSSKVSSSDILYVNTTAENISIEKTTPIVITSTGIIITSNNQSLSFSAKQVYDSFGDFFIEKGGKITFDLKEFLSKIIVVSNASTTIVYIFAFLMSVVVVSFNSALFAMVVAVMVLIMLKPVRFPYYILFRISVITYTPIILLEIINNFSFGAFFSNTGLIYFITHVLYAHLVLDGIKKQSFKGEV